MSTQMTIATYNLRNGGNANNRIHWAKLFDEVSPDIALFQESSSPEQYLPAGSFQGDRTKALWSKTKETDWGSAIYLGSGTAKPISVPGFEGWVVGAEVEGLEWFPLKNKTLRIFSIHAKEKYQQSISQILDLIATLPDDSDLIIGGDFNLTVGVRHPSEALQEKAPSFLKRLRQEFGLISCWQAANPNRDLAQTLRWSRDKTASYHCDGLFVPASWCRYLDKSEVLSSPDWEPLSDHNPVVASFSYSPSTL